jgi:VWFA-related protein
MRKRIGRVDVTRGKRLFKAAVMCAACAASAFAQSAPPHPPDQGNQKTAPLRVTSRLVQVNVIVQDKDGHPVMGLTKDDFILTDQGQKQQIAAFSEQKSLLTANGAAPSPNLFTNRFAQGTNAQPPLTVIVLDSYNARYWDLRSSLCPPPPPPPTHFQVCAVGPMFQEAEKFIGQMQPQDRVALYEFGDKLYLLQDFTSDPAALRRGLEKGKQYVPVSFPPYQTDNMDRYTMDAMHAIADRLASVAGRKNLIWLSPGFLPATMRAVTDSKISATAKTLGNADLPLSELNVKGMYVEDSVSGGGSVPGGGGGGGGPHGGGVSGGAPPTPAFVAGEYGPVARAGRPPSLHTFDFSKELADMSGGRAIENTNDLAGAIRRVINDSSATYLLSYYPDHNKWNGEFREIQVKVNRPGVEVRSRTGYYAVAETSSAPEVNARKLGEAIRSPQESTDLGLDVQADGVDAVGARQLKVKISLDPNQLHFQQQGARWTDNLIEIWAEFDSEGRQVATHSQTLNLKPAQEEYKAFLQRAFSFSETVPLAEGAEEVRLVVRDGKDGAIGSVIIPLAKLFAPTATGAGVKN